MDNMNSVDFFRFNRGYEDVFCDGDEYIYAQAEPFEWAYLMTCRSYRLESRTGIAVGRTFGMSTAKLDELKRAPLSDAARIIECEYILGMLASQAFVEEFGDDKVEMAEEYASYHLMEDELLSQYA